MFGLILSYLILTGAHSELHSLNLYDVVLSLSGDPGLTGVRGVFGDPGPKGERGDQGLQGPPGNMSDVDMGHLKGEKGDIGERGTERERGVCHRSLGPK